MRITRPTKAAALLAVLTVALWAGVLGSQWEPGQGTLRYRLMGWGSPLERAARLFPAIHRRYWSLPIFLCPTSPPEPPARKS
jgi:hypothetical protein